MLYFTNPIKYVHSKVVDVNTLILYNKHFIIINST